MIDILYEDEVCNTIEKARISMNEIKYRAKIFFLFEIDLDRCMIR